MTRRAHLGAPGDISVAARALQHYSILPCLYWETFDGCRLSSGPIDLWPPSLTLCTVICVFIMCLTWTFGQTREHASAPGGWNTFREPLRTDGTGKMAFLSVLELGWNHSLSPTHSCFRNSNNRFFFFADNKSHQDLCTVDYQRELFKAQITTLTPRW